MNKLLLLKKCKRFNSATKKKINANKRFKSILLLFFSSWNDVHNRWIDWRRVDANNKLWREKNNVLKSHKSREYFWNTQNICIRSRLFTKILSSADEWRTKNRTSWDNERRAQRARKGESMNDVSMDKMRK